MIRQRILLIMAVALLSTAVVHSLVTGPSEPVKATKPVSKPAINNCTTEPCIKITQSDKKTYKLNDFKFINDNGQKCILFISLPDNGRHKTCQPYTLTWIGPDNLDQKYNTRIE